MSKYQRTRLWRRLRSSRIPDLPDSAVLGGQAKGSPAAPGCWFPALTAPCSL